MSRRLVLIAAAVALAIAGVIVWRVTRKTQAHHPKVAPLRPAEKPAAKTDKISIKGRLFDEEKGAPIAAVKVVLLGAAGEESATTSADGGFGFTVPPGRYRVFVRDLDWITAGLQERIRIDDGPDAKFANVLDAHIAPLLVADTDLDMLEITATKAAKVSGRVADDDGNLVVGAAVRLRQPPTRSSSLRPVLGTDTAITNDAGEYTLAVPPGMYEMELRHPKYAGMVGAVAGLNLGAGVRDTESLVAVKGCIVRGKVVMADGTTPAPDGAVEVDNTGGTSFGPMARVALDGTFEFATTATGYLRVRAWPWKSTPSQTQEVDCYNGKRYDHITLKLEERPPDLAGTLVDAQGRPMPFRHVDLQNLDPGVTGQQERTDAKGEWHFYDVEDGNYRLIATAEGRGIADLNIRSPKTDIQL
ncbi:MAG TPA: carboxypeptidase-like regulatory domain-containing protein, partial [Kofleriaceae bacterium]|nr:carboxypeptidase-like regulatory domain-containing protein [Kofleriaceae bacterium]